MFPLSISGILEIIVILFFLPELAEVEEYQASIIESYLPQQMSEAEIETELKNIISETGAESMKDMGKVMGIASKKFAGKADNKVVAGMVRSLLG